MADTQQPVVRDAADSAPDGSTAPEHSRPRTVDLRASRIVLLVLLAVAVIGEILIRLEQNRAATAYWTASHNLRAYSVVAATDLVPTSGSRRSLPADAVTDARNIVGHITLSPVHDGSAFTSDDVSGASVALGKAFYITAMSGTVTQTIDGQLRSGDVVTLTFADARRAAVKNVLVMDVAPTGSGDRPYVIVLGTSKPLPGWAAGALRSGAVSLTRQP
jgi:hypothetical protein